MNIIRKKLLIEFFAKINKYLKHEYAIKKKVLTVYKLLFICSLNSKQIIKRENFISKQIN
jgi:hypothetical protein